MNLSKLSGRFAHLEKELNILKKFGLVDLEARKTTVSLRGTAKLLVSEDELSRSLQEAKRKILKRGQ